MQSDLLTTTEQTDHPTQFFPGVSHNIHMERPELVHHSIDSYLRRRKIAPSTAEATAP